MARRAAATAPSSKNREMEASSRQAAWLPKTTAYPPLLPARPLSRADEVKLHRLRLGYRTREELKDDFESRLSAQPRLSEAADRRPRGRRG
ncbi:hypothetical protein GWK47_021077 [Chionoecetes opilio]|uniref:Uncharacterized protein n=1 Tax=Chionoecetes opilio TaxID=41210 RepID=A0A8J4XPP6_CHIOP|nr:hypothetical protein GWK47_021077 [Chionoecetes opilio]